MTAPKQFGAPNSVAITGIKRGATNHTFTDLPESLEVNQDVELHEHPIGRTVKIVIGKDMSSLTFVTSDATGYFLFSPGDVVNAIVATVDATLADYEGNDDADGDTLTATFASMYLADGIKLKSERKGSPALYQLTFKTHCEADGTFIPPTVV